MWSLVLWPRILAFSLFHFSAVVVNADLLDHKSSLFQEAFDRLRWMEEKRGESLWWLPQSKIFGLALEKNQTDHIEYLKTSIQFKSRGCPVRPFQCVAMSSLVFPRLGPGILGQILKRVSLESILSMVTWRISSPWGRCFLLSLGFHRRSFIIITTTALEFPDTLKPTSLKRKRFEIWRARWQKLYTEACFEKHISHHGLDHVSLSMF